jgi:hypothetical protein
MEPRKYVIAKPDGAEAHSLAIDGGVNKFLRIEVILSEIDLNLDFRQSYSVRRKTTHILCLSGPEKLLHAV